MSAPAWRFAALAAAVAAAWLAAYRLPLRRPRTRQRVRLAVSSATGLPARYVFGILGTAGYVGGGLLAAAGLAWAGGVSPGGLLGWRPSAAGAATTLLAVLGASALTAFAMSVVYAVRPGVDVPSAVTEVRWIQEVLALPRRWRWVVPMLSAAVEEFFFRGVVLVGLLAAGASVWAAIAVSGALFTAGQALLTERRLQALVLALSSVVLSVVGGLLVVVEGSVLPAMLVHASFAGYYTNTSARRGPRCAAGAGAEVRGEPVGPVGKESAGAGAALVEARGVSVRYGALVAVDDVDLSVAAGEVVGVIGPNGAGKTSLLECIEGLRRPAAGRVRVAGVDPLVDRARMAAVAGVQLQHSSYPPRARVDELCRLFAGFYPRPVDYRELLAEFGLAARARARVTALSGGQQQRLSLVLALLGGPRVVFLDELTTGLDPEGRRTVWEALRRRNADGLTVVLTSHHMEEVAYLCDRVAVLVGGRLAALDTVSGLIAAHAGDRERILVEDGAGDRVLRGELESLGAGVRVTPAGRRLLVDVTDTALRPRVDDLLAGHGAATRPLTASLEDAYLHLTGDRAMDRVVSDDAA